MKTSNNQLNPPFKPWSSEEAFKILVENLADYAIFMLDPDGIIVSWNKGAQNIFGYTEAEAVGKHFSVIFTEEDIERDMPKRELETAARQGKGPDQRFHVHKSGMKFFVDGSVSPLYDDFGKIMGFAKIVHKISENIY